jgi:hypothetical protein
MRKKTVRFLPVGSRHDRPRLIGMNTRGYIMSSAAIVLVAVLALAALDHYGRRARVFGSAGPIDSPEIAKSMVSSSPEAYRAWKQSGFRGRTVISVADKWEKIEIADLNDVPLVSRPYPLELYQIALYEEQRGVTSGNFLYVAALNGIARRIIAILPQSGFDERLNAARSAKEKKISEYEIYLPHQGFPRWFTTAAHFSGAQEPALLYINASYFRTAEPGELYRQLKASGLMTDFIILCKGADNSGVTRAELERLYQFSRLIGMPVMGDRSRRSQPDTVMK